MKCPHCFNSVFVKWQSFGMGSDREAAWEVLWSVCPACTKMLVNLKSIASAKQGSNVATIDEFQVYPKGSRRPPLPPEVPGKFAGDYEEACLILANSPKASAALGRRCLENLLKECAGTKSSNLAGQIQEVIDSGKLPSDLEEAIDAIRNIGRFAAHPIKSDCSGDIVDVELGEAEWSLDVLEGLFDFYFVRPAKLKAQKEALNKKLKESGKPEMK